jgi:DNA-binding CsgD family transcriptional regulator
MRLRTQTLIEAAAGDGSVVDRVADEADRQEPSNLPDQIADLRTAAAFAAVWHGRPELAIEHVRRALRALDGTDGAIAPAWLLLAGMRAAADVAVRSRARGQEAADDIALASAWFDRAASLADGSFAPGGAPGPFPAMVRRLVEPELDRALGRDDPDIWLSTASAASEMGLPLFVVDAHRRAAELHLSAGNRPGAESALEIGASTARRIGAVQALRDIEALAKRSRLDLVIGPEAGDEGDNDAAAGSPDPWGLSQREREVLAMLADGRTNRQIGDALFISDKTASVHVTHILAKMGVSSRTEAALLAARAGATGDGEAGGRT